VNGNIAFGKDEKLKYSKRFFYSSKNLRLPDAWDSMLLKPASLSPLDSLLGTRWKMKLPLVHALLECLLNTG